jgi:hypothetical protein
MYQQCDFDGNQYQMIDHRTDDTAMSFADRFIVVRAANTCVRQLLVGGFVSYGRIGRRHGKLQI